MDDLVPGSVRKAPSIAKGSTVTYWCQKNGDILRLVLTVSKRCLFVFVSSIRLRICAAVPHVRFSLGGQLSTGQVVRSSLYFERSLPCG